MKRTDYGEIVPDLRYFICRYCTPKWTMNDSIINFVDLTYIFDGKVTYSINGVPYEAEKGDLICIPRKSLRHAEINPGNPMACYASNFWLTDLKGEQIDLPFPVLSKIGIREDIMSMYHNLNIEWLHKKPGYAMKVRSLFLSILHRYFCILYYKDSYENIDPRIQKVIRYIYENNKSHITVDDLASLVGLNTSYFGTLFRKSTGYTVKEFINHIRINNAENLLSNGDLSLREAALRSGFEDPFYFSKVFKRIKGYSPSKVVISTYNF